MARHDLYTNDPLVASGKQLHIPCYLTTSGTLSAIATMVQGDQAFCTDTNELYEYNGGWVFIGGGGAPGNVENTVVGMGYTIGSLMTLNLQPSEILAII